MTCEANVSRGGPRVLLVGADISDLTQAAALRRDQRLDRRQNSSLTMHGLASASPRTVEHPNRKALAKVGAFTHLSRVSLLGFLPMSTR